MDTSAQISGLQKEITIRLKMLNEHNAKHRFFAVLVQVSTVILATFSTILLGFKFGQESVCLNTWMKNTALIATGSITVINAVDAFFHPKSKWVMRKIEENKFKNLERNLNLDLLADAKDNEDIYKNYKKQFDILVEYSLREWTQLYNTNTTASEKSIAPTGHS